jgi:ABC-type nitrate/sulfonate/bicarbonate transport system permease component
MKKLKPLLAPIIIMLLWTLATQLHLVPALFLPSPLSIARSLVSLLASGDIIPDCLATLGRVFAGFVIAVAIGVPLGATMGLSHSVKESLEPSVEILRSVPTTALLPLFMLLFGIGNKSVIALITVPCIWTLTINTMYGVANGNKIRRDIAQLYKASQIQVLAFVVIPDAFPFIVAGLRLAMAVALHMAIAAEMLTGSRVGLGRRLFDAQLLLRVPELYALLLITGALGYGLTRNWLQLEDRFVHWSGR